MSLWVQDVAAVSLWSYLSVAPLTLVSVRLLWALLRTYRGVPDPPGTRTSIIVA